MPWVWKCLRALTKGKSFRFVFESLVIALFSIAKTLQTKYIILIFAAIFKVILPFNSPPSPCILPGLIGNTTLTHICPNKTVNEVLSYFSRAKQKLKKLQAPPAKHLVISGGKNWKRKKKTYANLLSIPLYVFFWNIWASLITLVPFMVSLNMLTNVWKRKWRCDT